MSNKTISRALCLTGAALIAALLATAVSAAADSTASSSDTITTVALTDTEITPTQYDGDLRNLPQVTYTVPRYLHMWNDFEEPRHFKPLPAGANRPESNPQVISLAPMPALTMNFAGLGFSDNVTGGTAGAGWPPDTNGDVGPTVYVEAVNDAFGIFDKATGSRLAAFTEDNLWSVSGLPSSNPCFSNNQGDPVVLHDGLADRWILTNFGFAVDVSGNPVAPFYQCIAVSKTSDPVSGGWWFYAVQMDPGGFGQPPANTFNDYGKFGLWTDCLYMGANGFDNVSGNYAGAVFASFNRNAIFAGQALNNANSSIGFIGGANAPFTMIPANLLGTSAASLPPNGTPEYFVNESGTAFNWEVRKFVQSANACGAGSSLTAAVNVSQASYGYPAINIGTIGSPNYTSNMVAQKGTTNKVDSLGDRLMQKVQYRRVGSTESLWVVHTTCGSGQDVNGACSASTSPAQPQWAQINVSNQTIATTPVQEQIYTPDTTLYRWMGSLAVDVQGNMALGYSTSSGAAFPGIAYAGRLVGDALNQLPQSETVLQAGAASQILKIQGTFVSRWGDYSAMSIDPSDDCTFWYTNEYYDTSAHGSSGAWQTRIGAFKFPGCVGPAAKLVFTQEPSASYASGATITVKVSIEDALGNVVTTDTSAVTLALGGGTGGAVLSGTKIVNAIAGVATFSNLAVDKVGTNYVLNATDGSLTGTASTTFNITPGPGKTVTFATQPAQNSNIAAGATIPMVAHVVDAGGNAVPNESITLGFNNNVGGSTLTVTANPVTTNASGDATFANVSLNKVGSGYTLKATDSTTPAATMAVSNAFNIVAGAAKTVTFTTQPAQNSNIAAGTTIPLVAHVVDAGGNPVANETIMLGFNNNVGGSTLSVTANPVATNASGDATFANVSLNKVGTGYKLSALDSTTPAATGATSNGFNIVAGAAKTVTFTTQPVLNSNITAATSIALTAHVVDVGGNPVANESIVLGIGNNPGGSTLSITVNPVVTNGSGDAVFANASLNKAGTGYTLTAIDSTTPAATAATSHAFNIVAGAAKTVTFTTQPAQNANVAAGTTIALVAHVVDTNGNAVSGESITLAFGNNAGGSTLSVTANPVATNAGGDAAFANVSLNKVGSGYTLTATDGTTPAATPATSHAFNIVAAAPATISFTQQPGTTPVNAAMTPALVVHELDGFGNLVSGDNVTLTIGTNPGGATLAGGNATATDTSGNATFGAVSLDKVGLGYTLSAHSGASAITTPSTTFDIIPGAPALAFTTQPASVVAGNMLNTIAVTEEDATGQPITTDSLSVVDFTVSVCGGSVDLGSAQMVNGVATLTSPAQRFYSVTGAPGLQVSATTGSGPPSGISQYFSVQANGGLLFANGFDGCRL